jgi:hypothetical protein
MEGLKQERASESYKGWLEEGNLSTFLDLAGWNKL